MRNSTIQTGFGFRYDMTCEDEYVNPFRCLGLRYLELFAAAPVEVDVLMSKECRKNGLVPVFSETCRRNFCEWSEEISGSNPRHWDDKRFEAALNCLLVLALRIMQRLAELLHLEADCDSFSTIKRMLTTAINPVKINLVWP